MRRRTRSWLAGLAMPLLLALAGCPPQLGDDDSGPDDDDSVVNDDDAVNDDDIVPPDDDDASDDDDNMAEYGVRSDDGSAPRHPGLAGLRA